MSKTILLEEKNKFVLIATGMIFCISGPLHIINNSIEYVSIPLGILMSITGVAYLGYSFVGFSKESKYAAKVRLTKNLIELKSSFWKPSVFIKWSDVKLIHFASYKVEFELTEGSTAFPYNTDSQRSRELKSTLREFAEPQNIQVIGG
ncbi:MAG: hypothetical protein RIC06_12035 [Cyclobacteriaceae bacterium]